MSYFSMTMYVITANLNYLWISSNEGSQVLFSKDKYGKLSLKYPCYHFLSEALHTGKFIQQPQI